MIKNGSSAIAKTPYILIEYTPAATEPVAYEFPFAGDEYSFYVNGSKTLTLEKAHPTITYSWEAANDAANKDKFSVTEADNVITMTGSAADTYTVTASWEADGTWTAGSATFTAEVKAIEQAAYTFPYSGQTISLEADATQTLDFGDTHPDFTWTKLSGDDVASVDENGVLTAGAAGTCVLQAEWAENQYFTAGNASFTVVVTRKAAGLAFGATEYSAQIGRAFTAPALTNPNNLTVAYISSVPGVATVDATSGAVTIVGEGTTVITATSAETDKIAAGEASYTLNVTELNEDVEVFAESATSWPTSSGSNFTGVSSTTGISYTVTQGYIISSNALYLKQNTGTATFTLPRNCTKIEFQGGPSGSAKSQLILTANGTEVTSAAVAMGKGLATIEIPKEYQAAGITYKVQASNANAQIASITYYYAAAANYTPSFADFELEVGAVKDVKPEGAAPEITYTSSSDAVTVNGSVLTAAKVGEATITASWEKSAAYNAGSATFKVTVKDATKRVFAPGFEDVTLTYGDTYKYDWGTEYPVTEYGYTPEGVVEIAEDGTMAIKSAGTTEIYAIWAGTSTAADGSTIYWEEGEETFTVTVNKATFSHDFEPATLTVGSKGTFEIEGLAPEITYTSSDDNGLLIVGDEYEAIKAGTYTVTATWGDNNWNEGSATFEVTVVPAPAAGKPVVKIGDVTITENTWNYSVVKDTEITISSENATKLRIWMDDEYLDDVTLEGDAFTLPIDSKVKYVFAGINSAGEAGEELVVTFKVYETTSETITRSNFTFSGSTTYSLSDVYTSDNNVSYIAFAQKTNTSTIGFNTTTAYQNSGVVVTANKDGYVLKQIIVTCAKNEGGVGVFGNTKAYTDPSELYDESTRGTEIATIEKSSKTTTTTIDVTGEYQYFGINSVSGVATISNITLVWGNNPTPEQPVADKPVTSLSENETISWTVKEGCVIKVTKLDDYYGATTVTSAPMRAAALTGEVPADGNWSLSNEGRTATYTAPANAEKVSYRIVAVNAAGDESKPFMFDVNDNGGVSGIDAVEADDTEAVEYYNLQGVRVEADNLTPGLYITRKGNNISKVVVR